MSTAAGASAVPRRARVGVAVEHTSTTSEEPVPPHEPMPDSPPRPGAAAEPATGLVDFSGTGRRLRRGLVGVAVVVLAVWTVLAVTSDASLRQLAELVGLGLLATFLVEVVVVGGAALRGLLAAGERGDRLAGGDVSLLPPQLTRRR